MKLAIRFLTVVIAITTSACASGSEPEPSDVFVRAAMGVRPGDSIGSFSSRSSMVTRKAVIDAVVGGAAGAVIGRSFDNLAAQLRTDLPQAHVNRVGEGLIVTFSAQRMFAPAAGQRPDTAALSALAARVARANGVELLVIADPDAAGGSSNSELAAFRARLIKDRLVRDGVPDARIILGQRPAQEQPEQQVQIALYASKQYRDAILSEYGRK